MSKPSTIRVSATASSALVFGESPWSAGALDAPESGERTLHLQRLRAHRATGFSYDLSGPNCVLRWARIPATHNGPVDVAIHFHGYKGHNQMRLAAKTAASGLDLGTPGVARPTLGVVPHGHAFASRQAGVDGFDFPAISSKAELDAFIDEALAAFNSQAGAHATRGRVILTGHSGGGAALSALMRSIGAQGGVHGFQYFDGTYGGQATLTARNGWVESAIQRDASALASITGEDARHEYVRTQACHLRICFIDGTGTAAIARAADTFMRERLAGLVADTAIRDLLRKLYRAQKVANPRQVNHGLVPRTYGGRLLADPASDLSPEAQDLTAAPARAHAYSDEEEPDDASQASWAEAQQDLVVPVLVTRERAADAPTGPAFIASLGDRKGVERENRIFEQLRAGNIPPSLLTFHTVRTSGNDRNGQRHEFEFYVTPDVLSIGPESDAVRIPMDPVTAQRVADLFECQLPTARMVEQIYQAAPTKLEFIYGDYAGTPRATLQDASSSYLDHSRRIDAQLRRPPTILTAGHKKELVISTSYVHPRRNKKTGETHPAPMLAFYGAYTARGVPIQAPLGGDKRPMRGYPSFAHEPSFVDYSHGVRLVWPTMQVDGSERRVADVLRDANLSVLIAAEGPIPEPRYTLDRRGNPVSARAQEALSRDPLALDAGAAWALQVPAQQPYLPGGGVGFAPQPGTFNCVRTGGFTVIPASFLPEPTTTADAAIDTALTAAGLTVAQRAQVSRPGLIPIAAAFGASALTELFARLRWAPDFLVDSGRTAGSMLVQRLLIHIPGHFRELARRAPSAVEAFVLECLGWAMMSSLRDAVESATTQRWWIPPAPDFVTAVPNPIPSIGTEVRRLVTRLGYIDTVMTAGTWNARYLAWRTGLAGRQWDSEVHAAQPGLPLYASLLSVPAHVNTAATRAAFQTAFNQRVADADAANAPMAATATQVTLPGLLNAISLRRCDNGNRHIPAGTFGLLPLQGLELAEDFPLRDGRATVRQLTLLNQLHPVYTALFRAIRELGWNDLVYQTSGATCFRGVKHSASMRVNVGGTHVTLDPFGTPTAAMVTQINTLATAAQRAAVIRAARSARTMSDHAMGAAVDINFPENVNGVAARPFGSMDPRVVALFEAFNFRWGACFNPTDPHHFDYCQAACAPAPAAGTAAPPAGWPPGMIPSGGGRRGDDGPVIA